jgi:hypothetical protein
MCSKQRVSKEFAANFPQYLDEEWKERHPDDFGEEIFQQLAATAAAEAAGEAAAAREAAEPAQIAITEEALREFYTKFGADRPWCDENVSMILEHAKGDYSDLLEELFEKYGEIPALANLESHATSGGGGGEGEEYEVTFGQGKLGLKMLCLTVLHVYSDSEGERHGCTPGSIVISINGKAPQSDKEYVELVETSPRPMNMRFRRKKQKGGASGGGGGSISDGGGASGGGGGGGSSSDGSELHTWLVTAAGLKGKKFEAARAACDDHLLESVEELRELRGEGKRSQVFEQVGVKLAIERALQADSNIPLAIAEVVAVAIAVGEDETVANTLHQRSSATAAVV